MSLGYPCYCGSREFEEPFTSELALRFLEVCVEAAAYAERLWNGGGLPEEEESGGVAAGVFEVDVEEDLVAMEVDDAMAVDHCVCLGADHDRAASYC